LVVPGVCGQQNFTARIYQKNLGSSAIGLADLLRPVNDRIEDVGRIYQRYVGSMDIFWNSQKQLEFKNPRINSPKFRS
jgi:hypothetical protein